MSMSSRKPGTLLTLILGAALSAAAVVAYQAGAVHAMLAKPTSVAVINMSKLMDSLAQGAEDRAVLEDMHKRYQEKSGARVEDLRKREEEATAAKDLAKREALLDKLVLDKLQFRLEDTQAQNEIMIEQALRFERLYQTITKAIAELAANEGYDLVIVDEATADSESDADAQAPEVMRRVKRLLGKRVLYTNPTIDITEQLIRRLNNAFQAKGA